MFVADRANCIPSESLLVGDLGEGTSAAESAKKSPKPIVRASSTIIP